LAPPDLDAKEAVQELAVHYAWLKPAAEELDSLGLEHWKSEHRRLLGRGSAVALCPPYESAYLRAGPHSLRIKSLKNLYRRTGMSPFGAPADYLGTLLECAADMRADATAGRDLWAELWQGHLASWVPRFCRDLRTESRMKLFRIVAERLATLFPEVRHSRYAVA
jgi:TorA maturation chaperone TorD